MTQRKTPAFKTTAQDKAAGRILLNYWTRGYSEPLDPERAEDLAQLIAMHRAGLIWTEGGDLTEKAYSRRFWHSKSNGTPARLLGIYGRDPWDPTTRQDLERATARAKAGETGRKPTHGGAGIFF